MKPSFKPTMGRMVRSRRHLILGAPRVRVITQGLCTKYVGFLSLSVYDVCNLQPARHYIKGVSVPTDLRT